VLIRDVMTEQVVTAGPGATVREVAELMRERNVGSVVLIEGARPVGFVTDRDLAVSVLADGRGASDRAGDHASAPVVCAAPGTSLQEAAEIMEANGVRRLVVVEDERLSGIITLDDLASRTGDLELARTLTVRVARATSPGFYFHHRGE